jgi:hypothetical protein
VKVDIDDSLMDADEHFKATVQAIAALWKICVTLGNTNKYYPRFKTLSVGFQTNCVVFTKSRKYGLIIIKHIAFRSYPFMCELFALNDAGAWLCDNLSNIIVLYLNASDLIWVSRFRFTVGPHTRRE